MALASNDSIVDPSAGFLIRPSVMRWGMRGGIVAFALLVSVVSMGIVGRLGGVVLALVAAQVLLIFAFYALHLVTYQLGTSIFVSKDALVVTHRFHSSVTVSVAEIARVFECKQALGLGYYASGIQRVLYVFSRSGKCLISLHADRWKLSDLKRVWQYLGITPEGSWDLRVTGADLRARFPGAF